MGALVAHLSSTLSQATGWIAGLSVPAGGAMLGYHAVARVMNDDPQHVAHHTASIRKVVTGTAIVGVAATIAHFASTLL